MWEQGRVLEAGSLCKIAISWKKMSEEVSGNLFPCLPYLMAMEVISVCFMSSKI